MAERWALVIGLLGLTAFCGFFLVRPLFGPPPPYGPRPAGTTYAYSFVVVAAFVPYGLALWATRHGVSLRTAVVGLAILHGLVIPAALTQSQDLYMYLFYGKLWAVHGVNPYLVEPLRFADDPWFPWLRWPNQVSVYGPLWTMISSVPARLAPGNIHAAFAVGKAIILVLGAAAATGAVAASRAAGRGPGRPLVMLGWNPLVIVSVSLGGHADVGVAAGLAWAVAMDRRGHPVTAATLLAGATLIKAYAGVALLVYLLALVRRGRVAVPAAGATAGLAVAALAPFWEGWRTLGSLASVAGRASASLAGELQRGLGAFIGEDVAVWAVRMAGLAVVVAVIARAAARDRFPTDPWPAAAAAFLAYVLVAPWFLYWHQVGLLVLAALGATAPVRAAAVTFSGTSLLTASFGATGWGRAFQALVRYGPPLGAVAGRPRRASGHPPASGPRS